MGNSKTQGYINQLAKFGANNYASLPVVIKRGEGIYVWDVDGRKYMDMLSGYSALNQGHCHPKIIAAAKEQLENLTLTSRAFNSILVGDFLEKIVSLTGMEKALPMNSGAEGVETAIKAMRRWGLEVKGVPDGRQEIIVAENNFHGRTTTIVSFSSDYNSRKGFAPFPSGFNTVPYNDAAKLEEVVNKNTVGVLMEPIQGEAGIIIPDSDYFPKVRGICNKHNILLCADEIQTGLGRTGKMFCCDHYGIKPDLYILGKSLSGGICPVSVVASNAEVMDVFTPGSHGSTYGGNPLAMAAAIAALDVTVKEELPRKAAERGKQFMEILNEINSPLIKEVRGKGLFIGMEFYEEIGKKVCYKLMEEGILAKDTHDTIVRFAPPLIITEKQVKEAGARIRRTIENYEV